MLASHAGPTPAIPPARWRWPTSSTTARWALGGIADAAAIAQRRRVFARDIAEINLLLDDLPGDATGPVLTGIPFDSPTGEAYVIARLAACVRRADAHADGVGKLAMWHPQLGAAHAALGEILREAIRSARRPPRYGHDRSIRCWPLQWYVGQSPHRRRRIRNRHRPRRLPCPKLAPRPPACCSTSPTPLTIWRC